MTAKQYYGALNILYGEATMAEVYDPKFHPDDLILFFRERWKELTDAERIETRQGNVSFVTAPVRIPTLAGYASKILVVQATLWVWSESHTEFARAMSLCKSMQEDILIHLGTSGSYQPRLVEFVLKNVHDWRDKHEVEVDNSVTLTFDPQDKTA